jgi:2-keto-3-deoxygluconate permease
MVLGNLDTDIRKVFAGGNAIILPFLGFEFGSTINLIDAFRMIPQGLLLSLIYFIVVITPSYIFERTVLHRPGYASVASGSLAGVALVIPSMAAASNAAFQPYVDSSVAVLAFVLAVTNILCPFMVKFILTKHPADKPAAAK